MSGSWTIQYGEGPQQRPGPAGWTSWSFEHNFMVGSERGGHGWAFAAPAPDPRKVFWDSVDHSPRVELCSVRDGDDFWPYLDLGMVALKGRLLQIDSPRLICANPEFRECISRTLGGTLSLRRLLPPPGGAGRLGDSLGSYVLFYGSSWRDRTSAFGNHVILRRWMLRLRTCDDCLVCIQRWTRRALRARRALAFSMGSHCRLGDDAAVACLGQDLARMILGMT